MSTNDKENDDKDLKAEVGDHVRISKYENIFAIDYALDWSEEVFTIKRFKNTVLWTYASENLNAKEIVGTFYERELKNNYQKRFIIEKVIKNADKLYVKAKGYDNSFNSWIDKKDTTNDLKKL